MDFVRYAERAVALTNAEIASLDDVETLLGTRRFLLPRLCEKDILRIAKVQRDLRAVFAASDRGDEAAAVELLNELLSKHPVSPRIAGRDSDSWHLHVADRSSSVAAHLTAEALLGLAMIVVDFGASRFGVCQADRCSNVFVDTSPNRSRRYCSDRCSTRANVAAYRARLKSSESV